MLAWMKADVTKRHHSPSATQKPTSTFSQTSPPRPFLSPPSASCST